LDWAAFALTELRGDFLKSLLLERLIAGTEVDQTLLKLRDSGAGSDGLIIDADVGMELVELQEPAFVKGGGKRGSTALDGHGIARGTAGQEGDCREQKGAAQANHGTRSLGSFKQHRLSITIPRGGVCAQIVGFTDSSHGFHSFLM